ncbi:MAG: hypothetical protein FWH32_02385 [Clostridiales bacterium]|nr:hypothetical protein [Clostridiales bacterium]
MGNFALIVLGLALDEYTCKEYQSEKFAADLKTAMQKSGKASKSYRIIRWHMDNFVSFKTVLYLFYIFILVASHIIAYNPALASEAFGNFIMANEYTILILIALDLLIRQFSIDRRKMRETSEKLERALAEDKD